MTLFIYFSLFFHIAIVGSADLSKLDIVPLKSDRSEIEKIYGPPTEFHCNECTYETSAKKFIVQYATSTCSGALTGWNVPHDTVLSFTVFPKKRQQVKDTPIHANKMMEFRSDDGTGHYVDIKQGIKYTVNPQLEVVSATHLPLESDQSLRCKGFPPYSVLGSSYRPIETSNDSDLEQVIARVQNGQIFLKQNNDRDHKMYVVLYRAQTTGKQDFAQYLLKLRRALRREISDLQFPVELINGGRKKAFQISLFFVKRNYPPPMPSPEFPS